MVNLLILGLWSWSPGRDQLQYSDIRVYDLFGSCALALSWFLHQLADFNMVKIISNVSFKKKVTLIGYTRHDDVNDCIGGWHVKYRSDGYNYYQGGLWKAVPEPLKQTGRVPTGFRARPESGVSWECGWSRLGCKMAATKLGNLLTKWPFWLSLWHDINIISISWHGGKEL